MARIETALRRLQADFPDINRRLKAERDYLSDEILENMMSGYAYIDELLTTGIELFSLGQLKHFLEINTRVLCGVGEAKRGEYVRHIQATEKRFYDEPGAGIEGLMEWHALHRRESPWDHAAGIYCRIMSKPQLFIEGNHRSGSLIMSYFLSRAGQPPFVLSADNASAYFSLSEQITGLRSGGFRWFSDATRLRSRLADFLKEQAEPGHPV
jgi:hypothetical protein